MKDKEEKTQNDFEADAERADDLRQEPECPHQTGQVTKDPDGVVWFVCTECGGRFLFDDVIKKA